MAGAWRCFPLPLVSPLPLSGPFRIFPDQVYGQSDANLSPLVKPVGL
ncbi:hypothetical protein PAHA111176_03440 [Parendozoicomonas haliclonae]|uniref:Uncharacterized protein n=1 Tax=Parendozoicomonas haliclonae TaxID=1960125 RepID=A0A1X7AJH3_9GAMM|nr:hypothetical protein EHSB41UT_02051 [Parendozoicomonas haliclonae]